MGIPTWLAVSVYSVILLALIYFFSKKSTGARSSQQKIYYIMLFLTAVAFAADCFSQLYREPGTLFFLARAGTYLKFLLAPLIEVFWVYYVSFLVLGWISKVWLWVTGGFYLLDVLFVLLPPFTVHLFTFDSQRNYYRGPLFVIIAAMMTALAVAVEVFVLANRKRIGKQYFVSLALFTVPPLVLGVLQNFVYGVPLVLVGVTLSLLNVFVYIQNRSIDIDYLTGTYNRRKLDIQMQQGIRECSRKKPFSAILIDLDYFKSINDTFGHQAGDSALEDAAALLKKCVGPADFLARYGGDEFCILLNTSRPENLEKLTGTIRKKMQRFNLRSDRPYRLSVSVGYAVYRAGSHMSMEDFQKEIDSLMYADKRKRHLIAKSEDHDGKQKEEA